MGRPLTPLIPAMAQRHPCLDPDWHGPELSERSCGMAGLPELYYVPIGEARRLLVPQQLAEL